MAGTCGVCKGVVVDNSDVLKCVGQCNMILHLDCANKRFPDAVKTRGSKKKDWTCDECKLRTTLVSSNKEEATTLTKEVLQSMLDSFKNEVFSELRNQSLKFEEFKMSIDFFSSKIDDASKAMEEIRKQNKEILGENENIKRENAKLAQRVNYLETQVRDLEQYSRRDNIEISGLPKTPDENEMELLKDVGRAIGVEVDTSDVVAVHRVPTYSRARIPPLIVRFNNRDRRNAWLQAYRQKKTLVSSEVKKSLPGSSRIYIGEHLTPLNKLILKDLKEAGKSLDIKYIWCREGKFYARKSDGMKSVRVNNVLELEKIKW